MNKTIGIVAHVDAGKTTFAEQLLFHTNSIRQRGRVDHKDAFMDSNEIEKKRGITIFSDQAVMNYKGSQYYLIDTPGHVDFSTEMERAIKVMDYAIIIISAVEGVEAHTDTVWHLLRKYNVPTFFFINKIDRPNGEVNAAIEDIRLNLTNEVCNLEEDLTEFIAERDEALLERYLENSYDKNLWLNSMRKMIKENKIFPVGSGSALQDIGVISFLDKLEELTYTNYSDEGEFSGLVYKIRHDSSGARVTYIKALQGKLRIKDEICCGEKVNQIRIYNGLKFKTVDEVSAGEIFAVTGLSSITIGQGIGDLNIKSTFQLIPTLTSRVIHDKILMAKDVLKCFKQIEEEDPSLEVTWEESLQEIHISVMGTIQLEVLAEMVKERFDFSVAFDKPKILYKETISSSAYGFGHFEPLKHYAEVHLKIEPGERNSGISFDSTCHTDNLTIGNQNLVKHHIFEREHHGLLTGSPLTDLNITLVNGRAHNKHTSGGDFREATFRALRQGLEQAQNILLEPYYDFKIKVNIDNIGRILSDIEKLHGSFEPPKNNGKQVIIDGKAPVATFMDYSTELASFSQGKGSVNLRFGGYYPCHNQEEIIAKMGYDKQADPEYSSSSIFCSKGQAFSIEWDKAKGYMHCL